MEAWRPVLSTWCSKPLVPGHRRREEDVQSVIALVGAWHTRWGCWGGVLEAPHRGQFAARERQGRG